MRYAIACTCKCKETRVLPFVFEREGHPQFQGAQHQTLLLALVHLAGQGTESRASFNRSHASISICHIRRNNQLPLLSNTHTTRKNTPIDSGRYSNNPWSHPLITCPAPSLNSNGRPLHSDFSQQTDTTDHTKNQKLHHSRKVSHYPLPPPSHKIIPIMHLKFISILSFTSTFFLWNVMFYTYNQQQHFWEGETNLESRGRSFVVCGDATDED
jgi:hypothetical protein